MFLDSISNRYDYKVNNIMIKGIKGIQQHTSFLTVFETAMT